MNASGWYLLGLLSGLAFWITDAMLARHYRNRRRGGWLKPPASSTASPRTAGRSTIRPTPADSSSPLAPGHLSAVAAVRLTPPPPSSVGGPGWSTRVPDGGAGIGRTPPAPAASAEPYIEDDGILIRNPNACTCPTDRPCDCPPAVRAFMEPPGSGLLRRNRGDDAA